jgi:hypothetical protein
MGWSVLLPGDGELVDLAGGDAGGDVGRGEGRQAGQAGEQGAQRDFAVHSGEGGTQAEVGSGGEAEVGVGVAADVESVGIGEGGRVAVRGGQEQHARLPGRAGDAVHVGIGSGCYAGKGGGESRRRWRGSLARCLQRGSAPARAAARRAVTPHPAAAHPAVTHRGSRAARAGRAGRLVQGTPVAGRKVTGTRAGTPRIVRVGPSSVQGTRRSFLPAPQKASSGPTLERWRPLPTRRGLTARARPEARPYRHAANLRMNVQLPEGQDDAPPLDHPVLSLTLICGCIAIEEALMDDSFDEDKIRLELGELVSQVSEEATGRASPEEQVRLRGTASGAVSLAVDHHR